MRTVLSALFIAFFCGLGLAMLVTGTHPAVLTEAQAAPIRAKAPDAPCYKDVGIKGKSMKFVHCSQVTPSRYPNGWVMSGEEI